MLDTPSPREYAVMRVSLASTQEPSPSYLDFLSVVCTPFLMRVPKPADIEVSIWAVA